MIESSIEAAGWGLGAAAGIVVVVELLKRFTYALSNGKFNPLPDFWLGISVLVGVCSYATDLYLSNEGVMTYALIRQMLGGGVALGLAASKIYDKLSEPKIPETPVSPLPPTSPKSLPLENSSSSPPSQSGNP